jgi:hypothetical protein
MTPEQRREQIRKRIESSGFNVNKVAIESGYQGLPKYLAGTDAGDSKLYDVEQALDRLEAK